MSFWEFKQMYEFMEKNTARMYSKMLLGLPSLMYLLFIIIFLGGSIFQISYTEYITFWTRK
jgi:hypothetical protein